MKRKIQITITVAVVFVISIFNVSPLYALIWDGGYHEFSEGFEDEAWLINDATADITGGEIGQLLCYDTSSVFVYEPSYIDLLRPNDSSLANVYGGTINVLFVLGLSDTHIYGGSINEIEAVDVSTLTFYVESYNWDPHGGSIWNKGGLITGTWMISGESFSIDLVTEGTINHINFVPEPCSAIFLISGGIVLGAIRRKTGK